MRFLTQSCACYSRVKFNLYIIDKFNTCYQTLRKTTWQLVACGLPIVQTIFAPVHPCRYSDASALRDQLKALQQQADAAAAAVAEQRSGRERQFRLGQRVLHAQLGYRGIVCGCACPSLQATAASAVVRQGFYLRARL